MNAAILLCAALLAADNPALVQAKIFYGSEPRNERLADIELWISQEAAKAGSPLALPYTGWIELTGEQQRIFTSARGGCIIDGKAVMRNDKYYVEIDGCNGAPLKGAATLLPGERRIINLSESRAPHNVFVALQAPLSETAAKRVETMKAAAATFQLELNYNGQEDKPFYRLIVSVPQVGVDRSNPFYRIVQIKAEQAPAIIDHLASVGFFDTAVDLRTNIKVPAPTMPGYTLKVSAGDHQWYADLGWGLPMFQRLDGLHAALPEAAKKDMDFLLGRLSGLRATFKAERSDAAEVD